MEDNMKFFRTIFLIFLYLFIMAGCNTSKELVKGKSDDVSAFYNYNVNQKSWDNYAHNYLKQRLNTSEIINYSNQLFIARSTFTDGDDINFWDLCVIEGINQKIDVPLIIDIVSKIIEERRSYNFVDNVEKNFWDLSLYELLKIKYDNSVIYIATEIILGRRRFMQTLRGDE